MKKDLAIIGASYLQLPLIEKAKEMGYTTHVFAWAANDVGEKAADHFYPISIVEKDEILKKCKEIGICGICSIASDLAVITVNYVSANMGLTGNSLKSTSISTNKFLMRKAFQENGDPSPLSIPVDQNTDLTSLFLKYPVIVKPTDRSGSRCICKLESKEGLEDAVSAAIEASFEKKALIEEYAEGTEYSVEFISYKGKHTFLALTLKQTSGAPNFIEKSHIEPAPIDDHTLQKIKKTVTHALDSLLIENGASHSEIKIDQNGTINLIEIGARMGGDCIGSDLVRYSTGYDYIKMVIQIACGMEPDFSKAGNPVGAEVRFIFDENDIREFEMIKRSKPDILLKTVFFEPKNIGKTTDSSNRVGCYIIKNN